MAPITCIPALRAAVLTVDSMRSKLEATLIDCSSGTVTPTWYICCIVAVWLCLPAWSLQSVPVCGRLCMAAYWHLRGSLPARQHIRVLGNNVGVQHEGACVCLPISWTLVAGFLGTLGRLPGARLPAAAVMLWLMVTKVLDCTHDTWYMPGCVTSTRAIDGACIGQACDGPTMARQRLSKTAGVQLEPIKLTGSNAAACSGYMWYMVMWCKHVLIICK